jgi:hypothetical protein
VFHVASGDLNLGILLPVILSGRRYQCQSIFAAACMPKGVVLDVIRCGVGMRELYLAYVRLGSSSKP